MMTKGIQIDSITDYLMDNINKLSPQEIKEIYEYAVSKVNRTPSVDLSDVVGQSEQLPCKHEHIESSDGCDECMDCGARNY